MEQWLPPEARDTSWYLFNERFMCRVPNIQTMSVDYLRQFGMPTSGDPRIDQEMANELVQRSLTIDRMFEYHRSGVQVRVMKEKDTARIYEIISNHLQAWRTKLQREMNVGNAPLEDLIALDAFAAVVYKHARHQFTREFVESTLVRKMSSTLRVTRDSIIKRDAPEVIRVNPFNKEEEAAAQEQKFPEHDSMAEAFTARHRSLNGGPKWS